VLVCKGVTPEAWDYRVWKLSIFPFLFSLFIKLVFIKDRLMLFVWRYLRSAMNEKRTRDKKHFSLSQISHRTSSKNLLGVNKSTQRFTASLFRQNPPLFFPKSACSYVIKGTIEHSPFTRCLPNIK
jgi:hypothetical protein